jgi:outer membrane protein OmpA-like peptidoglycan-associated protein
VDLGRGTVVSKVLGRSEVDGVDTTPTAFYRESIVWSSSDPSIVSYTRTCEAARPGDAVEPLYRQRIVTAAVLREAILLYEAGNFQAAEELFRGAAQTAQGGQLRVLNGWFLSDWNLEKRDEAAEAARRLADYGLEQRGFAMMFSFPPGRASFDEDSKLTGAYMILLRELARKVAESNDCLLVVGHASRSGSEPYNERLSLARANYVKARLRSFSRQAGRKTTTEGVGSREVLVGTGTDDLLDALDRRVEVRVSACPS